MELLTPINYTCSNLAEHLDDVSHDAVTDYLQRERLSASHLWEVVKSSIHDKEESFLIMDDSVQIKRYARKMEMVKRQYSGAVGGLEKGIGVVNLVHTDGKQAFYPIDFRIYAKEWDGKTKNDHFREMLLACVTNKQVKARQLLFDSWYASWDNLKLADRLGFKFYTTLKSNRLVREANSKEYQHLDEIEWTDTELREGKIVKLSKIPFMVKLFKIVAKNGGIDWVITNNPDSTNMQFVQEANKVRWEVEQFHRELKQLTGSEKCQCRKQRSQRNHLANCYYAWLSLKLQARKVGKTVYEVRQGLFREYLRAELKKPTIQAYVPV